MKKSILIFLYFVIITSILPVIPSDVSGYTEEDTEFIELKEYMAALSVRDTLITIAKNFTVIDRVYKTPYRNIVPKERKLKELLLLLDRIDYALIDKEQKMRIMYNEIIRIIPVETNHITLGSKDIIYLLSNSGDCNDYIPAFLAIFNYFNIDCYAIFGQQIRGCKKDNDLCLHVWLGIYVNKRWVELDPTWYNFYVELRRNYMKEGKLRWPAKTIKDEYIKRKP